MDEGVKNMKIHMHETLVGVVKNNDFHVFSIRKRAEMKWIFGPLKTAKKCIPYRPFAQIRSIIKTKKATKKETKMEGKGGFMSPWIKGRRMRRHPL